MADSRTQSWGRREFVAGLTGLGAAGVLGVRRAAAEPAPETTRLRLSQIPGICVAPQYVAQELLQAEGFTDVRYVYIPETNPYPAFVSGELDISMAFVAPFLVQVDAGLPIVLLAGVHVGCFEVFGTPGIRAIRDLKGRTVAVPGLNSAHHIFLSSMAAYVGSILERTSSGSLTTRPNRHASSLTARSMPSSGSHLFRRSSGRRGSGTSSSTARWIVLGQGTSAASWLRTRRSWIGIP
jgi:hypothetical protein